MSELAAMASGDDADHLADCARCRAIVDDQRATRRLLAGLPFAAPDRAYVDRLAAEVIARSDLAPARSHRRGVVIAGLALAAAAAIAVATIPRSPGRLAAAKLPAPRVVFVPPPLPAPPAPPEIAPAPEPAAIAGDAARFERRTRHGRDELVLRDGAITIDGRDREPVDITAGATRVRVGDARVAVKARRGAIVMVTVIAGSAEVSHDGRRQIVEAGVVWEPPAEVAPESPPPPDTVTPFSTGWTALRDGRLDDAIDAFDHATDPAVAEDAAYWAAVAAERAGRPDARRRFEAFLVRYPASPRVAAAQAAVARNSPAP